MNFWIGVATGFVGAFAVSTVAVVIQLANAARREPEYIWDDLRTVPTPEFLQAQLPPGVIIDETIDTIDVSWLCSICGDSGRTARTSLTAALFHQCTVAEQA